LQLSRLELEAAERQHNIEAAERQRTQDIEAGECKYKIDAAEWQRHLELEADEKNRPHELEVKRLELAAQSFTATADDRRQAPVFRIDTAVKFVPKFNDHDVESFLLSFDNMAQLNQ